jgi:hypothetical protein
MQKGIVNLARRLERTQSKGQTMAEFAFVASVAMVLLFFAIQMAALGRESIALGDLNYQVTRWATSPGNEDKQCQSDVETYAPSVASGFLGKVIGASGISCSGTSDKATPNGVTLTMACVQPGGGTSCASRPVGTVVNIQIQMGTKNVLFLSKSATSFLGIPFPSQLTSTQSMLTQ